jgi:hypothetical protein
MKRSVLIEAWRARESCDRPLSSLDDKPKTRFPLRSNSGISEVRLLPLFITLDSFRVMYRRTDKGESPNCFYFPPLQAENLEIEELRRMNAQLVVENTELARELGSLQDERRSLHSKCTVVETSKSVTNKVRQGHQCSRSHSSTILKCTSTRIRQI